jgi:ParB family chromosome partitioning protein
MSYAEKLNDVALLLDELEGLESAVGYNGAPLELALNQIEEDPGQPRRNFDQAALEELAASIRERDLLQPIGVTEKQENGKHRIIFGARRFRAARLADLTTIKAIIQAGQVDDPYDQMVENIQRNDLSAIKIAAFIEARLAAGEKQKGIARRLAKSKGFVAMHASISQMPVVLRDKLSASPLRAVYELYQLWKRDAARVEEFCSQHETFTRPHAEAFIEEASAKPSDNGNADQTKGEAFEGNPHSAQLTEGTTKQIAGTSPEGVVAPTAPRKSSLEVVVRVRHGQKSGHLVLGRLAKKGSHFGIVVFDDHGDETQVSLAELALVEIRMHEPL